MPRNTHFEDFQPHTEVKHFLLESYLKGWASIHMKGFQRNPRARARVWFLDAFAGAGRDKQNKPGSPVIAAEIAVEINSEYFPSGCDRDSGMKVVATELHKGRAMSLVKCMEPYSGAAGVAFARQGTLAQYADLLLPRIGGDPAFYFLDPFGIQGLDASLLPKILSGQKTEILVLIADEGAVRLAGKAKAKVPNREELFEKKLGSATSMLWEDADADQEEVVLQQVDRVMAGHASNDNARSILNRAFGGTYWERELELVPPDQRRRRVVELYDELLRRSGAGYILHFRVTTQDSRHKYTLMHASKHSAAYLAMKHAMHRTWRKSAMGATPGLFGDAPSHAEGAMVSFTATEIGAAVTQLAIRLAGKRLRWTSEKTPSVKDTALRETPVLMHELPSLKSELQRRGYGVTVEGKPVKPEEFEFPPR